MQTPLPRANPTDGLDMMEEIYAESTEALKSIPSMRSVPNRYRRHPSDVAPRPPHHEEVIATTHDDD